jgi:hypothetical protein
VGRIAPCRAAALRLPSQASRHQRVAEWAEFRQPAACRGRQVADRYAAMERQSVHPQPAEYRQAVSLQRAAYRGRRAEDRYAAPEHQSAHHLPVASSWLRRLAARPVWSCPAVPASASWPVLRAADPSSRRRAGRRPDPSAGQAGWSARAPWSAEACGSAQPRAAACAREALPSEAVYARAVPQPAAVAAGQPSAVPVAAEARPASGAAALEVAAASVRQRAAAAEAEPVSAGVLQREAEVAQPASAAEPRREAAVVRPASAAQRSGVLPSAAAFCWDPQPVAPARR